MASIAWPSLAIIILLAFVVGNDGSQSPPCNVSRLTGQVISHEEPCFCDGNFTTVCEPSDICLSLPADDIAMPDPSALQCFKVPCDDLVGDWIWLGRLPKPWSPGNFTVWGLVAIEQTEVCQQPVFTVTSNYVDANGTLVEPAQVKTFYGLLQWREIYSFVLFDSPEERDAFEAADNPDQVPDEVPDLEAQYFFLQDFGDTAPQQQCTYFGSFLYRGFGPDSDSDADDYSGTLARDVEGKYALGDIILADEAPSNRNCPEGYPRDFPVPTTTSTPSSTTTPAPTGVTSGATSLNNRESTLSLTLAAGAALFWLARG